MKLVSDFTPRVPTGGFSLINDLCATDCGLCLQQELQEGKLGQLSRQRGTTMPHLLSL